MATQRAHSAALLKLLGATKQPIYVLDEELTIVFLNRACLDWLETDESLLGVRCTYHSSPTGNAAERLAAGLCPPPQVLEGRSVTALVARVSAAGTTFRRARFLPLGLDADAVWGVVALVDTTDQTSDGMAAVPASSVAEDNPTVLHERLCRFRGELAANYRADRLIGQGPAMQLARRQVELAAAATCSVLLVGPPGSGRRHLAAAIHYGSAAEILLPLDCSVLGADLIEAIRSAELKTRAVGSTKIPVATLLLHRLDELGADVQAELAGILLRSPTSWRLIATAAEPLSELAQEGKFRTDLAAALSTIVIRLPSLAQRPADLALLAQMFLEDQNAAGLRQVGGFTPAALDMLSSYGWPGNLDELFEVVAESHRRAIGREIDVGDLPERIRLAGKAAAHPKRPEEKIVLEEYLQRVERELIRRALGQAKGNKARAARLLGITRPKLYRRMVLLGLESAGPPQQNGTTR